MVVADTPATSRTLHRTIIKNVFARLFIMTNNIRFTTSSFHFVKRPQFFSACIQLCLQFQPIQDPYGGSRFSQNRLSMLRVVLCVVLVTIPYSLHCQAQSLFRRTSQVLAFFALPGFGYPHSLSHPFPGISNLINLARWQHRTRNRSHRREQKTLRQSKVFHTFALWKVYYRPASMVRAIFHDSSADRSVFRMFTSACSPPPPRRIHRGGG